MKKENTPEMFDTIAQTYDKLNHSLSFSFDKIWRKKFVNLLADDNYEIILDVASGTGDLLVELEKLKAKKYIAIDPSKKMLEIAREKFPEAEFIISKAENLSLEDNSINLITVSFGIRNFTNIDEAFKEFYRVSKKNACLSIMEFSLPKNLFCKLGFKLYLKLIIPFFGRVISKDKQAYKYLSESIVDFANNINVTKKLKQAGFSEIKEKNLMCGAVKIYKAKKYIF
ncbi:MAG: bifunctional demethylmenaquinone methyltransferase/2-methoxy-6-polyprenyl-1,4-benzoquinol methylase UbiE [Bacteroidales bacterium]|jgi:demethylmenaquinone methyltransferase/2-methoxy-6-polyprenyl-1,4-benzoquinol methylase|nr:bifunctional demethylmenaquinone methyltransferase/2-methoxy-6-polyprenyl-1,4-benzoquinol methylase UbiE [Bacteroidales bacterium]MCK9499625.1 bifunctional demethylmenaquinone methyltransferase/2-methoxy-6-polyprenyl-1,4-benzoquinol methylase UbiE [Bacteroidales bacterium]MDY0313535.1 bifunctional demethylmenaquinone methyltransferase/2-methoxy-6-polyprenyl-1,4-benzoquinol methylase UbiE [Bacteroidales bacterium]NLB85563.1 bifunctional demethylmenaquinone methyltransferase/2-methoxy-6-polypre